MSFLDELIESTRRRVAGARELLSDDVLEQRITAVEPARGFAGSLQGDGVALIAEIKRASPAAGDLAVGVDAAKLARSYADGGAAALSVLTEPSRFKGSLEDLQAACGAGLPVLRKDLILDELQVFEARAWGADAILLIVRALPDDADLGALQTAARALGMDALVEVHDDADLDRALDAGADLIGINHRDLVTLEVDPGRTEALAGRIPGDATLVALSGVSSRADVERLAAAGADAVLVGESVVTAPDPAAKLRELAGS